MNKKATTIISWVEVIIFIFLFLIIIGIIGGDMNSRYGGSRDLSLGLNVSQNFNDLIGYKATMQNSTDSGQVSMTDFGILKLVTTPTILFSALGIIWNFVNGSFIDALVGQMNLGIYGIYIALTFKALYFIAVGFILIKLVLRIAI
jgi:hypothetical protein